jgi:hypothetical protein
VTRAQLLALADQADDALRAAVEAGDREGALKALRQAELWREMARLTPGKPSGNLREMTDAQLERRGKAIAAAKNAKTKDKLLKAITASQWGSQERYARHRLGISPPALTGYRNGSTPCPRIVADRVLKDFGIAHDYWPAGVVN